MIVFSIAFLRLDAHGVGRKRATRAAVSAALFYTTAVLPAHSEMLGLRAATTARSPRSVVANAIQEASRRFHVPPDWIRAVMRAESNGDAKSVSEKGAIGLMQVMPKTYAELQAKLSLGPDPFDPHDNIVAGAAYLAEMFDRYGEIGVLAAYNAGPRRYEDHLLRGRPLPTETTDYVARLAPELGFACIPAAAISAPPYALRAPMFVTLAAPKMAREATADGGANRVRRSQKAALHPLFPAPRDDKIFAREPHSDSASRTLSPADSLQTAGVFVARTRMQLPE
ncbi:Lytic transglycosylase catalytic region [Methylocystis sp. SC2]|nr:Lytic transglycosylase catalytic region [Methylocystis sp. SC2]